MSLEPLLNYEPLELSFQSEQNNRPTSVIRLSNDTDNHVAFKLKSTSPRNYVVRPRIGILLPRSTCQIKVTMVREVSRSMRCKDKFMIESAVAAPDTTPEDAQRLFDRESGHPFQQFILRVVNSSATESPPRMAVVDNTVLPAPESDREAGHPSQQSIPQVVNNSATEASPGMAVVEDSRATEASPGMAVVENSRPTEASPVTAVVENTVLPALEEVNSVESIIRAMIRQCTAKSILKEAIGSLLVLVSLYLMKRTLSWIWSLAVFVMMLIVKMIKKLVSDSVEDWIVKTLVHIAMYILFGRNNAGST